MLTIAVDICNTIADVIGILKKMVVWPDEKNYFHPQITDSFFEKNPFIFEEAMPYEGTAESLRRLSRKFRITYLSARPPWALEITRAWLKKYGFPAGEIILTKNKAQIARKIGILVVIEDAPHEIVNFRKNGIQILIKKQPYNLDCTRYGTFFDWPCLLPK